MTGVSAVEGTVEYIDFKPGVKPLTCLGLRENVVDTGVNMHGIIAHHIVNVGVATELSVSMWRWLYALVMFVVLQCHKELDKQTTS